MNLTGAINEVRRAGGMDVDRGQAASWISDRLKTLCVEAEWLRALVKAGPLVADQAAYDLPDRPEVAKMLRVQVGALTYQWVGLETAGRLETGLAVKHGSGGTYSESYTAKGEKQITLHPAPGSEDAGLDIDIMAVVEPDDAADGVEFPIPRGLHRAPVHGAMADAFRMLDQNPEMADHHERKFNEAVEELHRRAIVRSSGAGPHRMQIRGVHY